MVTGRVGIHRNYKKSTQMVIFFAILPNALAYLKGLCYAAFSESLICFLLLVNVGGFFLGDVNVWGFLM